MKEKNNEVMKMVFAEVPIKTTLKPNDTASAQSVSPAYVPIIDVWEIKEDRESSPKRIVIIKYRLKIRRCLRCME